MFETVTGGLITTATAFIIFALVVTIYATLNEKEVE
jgi:hypothetical protein